MLRKYPFRDMNPIMLRSIAFLILLMPKMVPAIEGSLQTDVTIKDNQWRENISTNLEAEVLEDVRILAAVSTSEKSIDTAALELSLSPKKTTVIVGKQAALFGRYIGPDEIFEDSDEINRIIGASAIFSGNIPNAIDLLEVSVFETDSANKNFSDLKGISARVTHVLDENLLLGASGALLEQTHPNDSEVDVLATVGLIHTSSDQKLMWWVDGSTDNNQNREITLGIAVKLWEKWTMLGRYRDSFDEEDKKLQFHLKYDFDNHWTLTNGVSFDERKEMAYQFKIKYLFNQ